MGQENQQNVKFTAFRNEIIEHSFTTFNSANTD